MSNRKPIPNTREPYASMSRKQLIKALDDSAKSYNKLEKSRDKIRRKLAKLIDKLSLL